VFTAITPVQFSLAAHWYAQQVILCEYGTAVYFVAHQTPEITEITETEFYGHYFCRGCGCGLPLLLFTQGALAQAQVALIFGAPTLATAGMAITAIKTLAHLLHVGTVEPLHGCLMLDSESLVAGRLMLTAHAVGAVGLDLQMVVWETAPGAYVMALLWVTRSL
jgi:hypothetical protein